MVVDEVGFIPFIPLMVVLVEDEELVLELLVVGELVDQLLVVIVMFVLG